MRSARATSPTPWPTWWQRRYLLQHFQDHGDLELAHAARLPVPVVQAFLLSRGAVRTAAQVGRLERRHQRGGGPELPPYRSPRELLALATRLDSRPLGRLDALLILVVFLGSLLLYAATAARTVTGEDAGELLAAAHGFGVPHPPGYPLWLLLAWLFDHASTAGTVAWRISLVSAVFSAAANALFLGILLKTLASRLVAALGAGLFAVSLTHWSQATIPEVYGLNTFFVALSVLLVMRLKERPTAGRLLTLAFVVGLSATNHPTAMPVGLAVAVAALAVAPRLLRRPGVVAGALVAGLAPLLLYAVLPWASARDPYIDWGNPETLDRLVAHVTRSQYTSVETAASQGSDYGDYLRRVGILGRSMAEQFGSGWVLLLAIVGFFAMVVRQPGVWLLLLAVGWLCSIGITQYSNYSFDREHVYANQIFFIPAWMTVTWLLAGGLDTLRLALGERSGSASGGRGPWLAAPVAGALIVLLAAHHIDRVDRSETALVADYGRALLDTMEPGALYFPASDHSTFAVMYWQGVLGYRTDVTIADTYGRLDQALLDRWAADVVAHAIRGQPGQEQRRILEQALIERWPGPVYFANRRVLDDCPGRRLEPVGPLYRVMSEQEAAEWWELPEEGGDPPGLAFWRRLAHLDLDDPVEGLDFTVQMIRGDLLSMRGIAEMGAGRLDEALVTWDRIEGDLAPLKQVHNNIGSALAEHGRREQALLFYERALDEDREYAMALRNAAIVHRDLGQTAQAVALLERLLAVEPDHREGRLEHARLLERLGRLHDALAAYEAMARRDRRDPLPWLEAGTLLQRHGDREKAKDAFAEALRLHPGHPVATEAIERLRRSPPAWLAQGPQPLFPSTTSTPLGLDAALADLEASFGGTPFGPPMPRLPGAAGSDALLPGAPVPPSPEHALLGQLGAAAMAGGPP